MQAIPARTRPIGASSSSRSGALGIAPQSGEFNRPREGDGRTWLQGFGGDSQNVVIAAARQGAVTGYLTSLGQDWMGDAFLELWKSEGVDASRVIRHSSAPTGVSFVTFSIYRSAKISEGTPFDADGAVEGETEPVGDLARGPVAGVGPPDDHPQAAGRRGGPTRGRRSATDARDGRRMAHSRAHPCVPARRVAPGR